MRRAVLGWVFVAGMLTVAPAGAQETLTWHWTVGDTWVSRMSRERRLSTEQTDLSTGASRRGASSELLTWTTRGQVRDVDAEGNATVDWTIARIQLTTGDARPTFYWDSDRLAPDSAGSRANWRLPVRSLAPLVGGRLEGVVTPRGELIQLTGLDSLRARVIAVEEPAVAPMLAARVESLFTTARAQSLLLGDLPPLPDSPVDVGDSWVVGGPIPELPSLAPLVETRSTWVGNDSLSSERAAFIRLDATARLEPAAAGDADSARARTASSTLTATGDATFSLDRGRLLRSSHEGDAIVSMAGPSGLSMTRQVVHRSARFELLGPEGEARRAPLLERPPAGVPVVDERSWPGGVIEWRLANGIRVLLEPRDFEEPRVVLLGMSDGGTSLASEADVESARSAVALTARSGVGDLSGFRLFQALRDWRVSVDAQISEWGQAIRGMADSADVEGLLQLAYLKLTAARADSSVLDSWRSEQEQALSTEPPTTARVIEGAWSSLIGADHPWARPLTVDALDRVDLERSLAFYRERFADVGDMTFTFVGSFDPGELRPLVERYIGALPATGRAETWRDRGWRPPDRVVSETVRDSIALGSNTRLLFHGLLDYGSHSEIVRVRALGAALEIRLRRALRTALGEGRYVSVRTSAARQPYGRYELEITFASEPEDAEGVVSTIFEQISALKADGPSSEEAARARAALLATNERNLARDTYWSDELARAAVRGEPPTDRIRGEAPLIEAVDADLVREAARAYLSEERYVRLTVGPDTAAGSDGGWLDPRQMQRRSDVESRRGYYAARLEGRWYEGALQYRAAYARFPTMSRSRWYWGMTEEVFDGRDRALADEGYSLIWRQDFIDGDDAVRVQAVWLRFDQP